MQLSIQAGFTIDPKVDQIAHPVLRAHSSLFNKICHVIYPSLGFPAGLFILAISQWAEHHVTFMSQME